VRKVWIGWRSTRTRHERLHGLVFVGVTGPQWFVLLVVDCELRGNGRRAGQASEIAKVVSKYGRFTGGFAGAALGGVSSLEVMSAGSR